MSPTIRNGFQTCQHCRHWRVFENLDGTKRTEPVIATVAGKSIEVRQCKRYPGKAERTATPGNGSAVSHAPGVPVTVLPLVPAIVVAPEGVAVFGYGRIWPPHLATDDCGEFEAVNPA